MSTPPAAKPDPKQASYDALNNLLQIAEAAQNNPTNTTAARDLADDLMTKVSAQLDALDQAVVTEDTLQLQAAATAMTPEMKDLKALQTKIAALGKDMKEGAAIISGIDKALGELSILGL